MDNTFDAEFEQMWKAGERERQSKRNFKFYTEIIPNHLKKLEKLIKVFGKIKLNNKGLPF